MLTMVQVLEEVEVTPPFHWQNSGEHHPGHIVPNLSSALAAVQHLSRPSLTDLLIAASSRVPPGFTLAVREVATQARMWGLEPASLILKPQRGEATGTGGCTIVSSGGNLLVLRLAEAEERMIKIAISANINADIVYQNQADKSLSPYVCKLWRDPSTKALFTGKVHGAGAFLAFVAVEGYCPKHLTQDLVSTTEQAAKIARQVRWAPKPDTPCGVHLAH